MHTIKIYKSTGGSPRDWDNLGIIAAKNFNADESISDPVDWLAEKLGLSEMALVRLENKLGVQRYSNKFREALEARFKLEYVVLPVYKYEHSGIKLSTTPFSCRWDSGQLGYIYATKEQIRANWSIKRITAKVIEDTFEWFRNEIETFSLYVQGEVYGFDIEDDNGENVDSCGGFYGQDWDTNGILDHIDFEAYGWTRAEALELIENSEIEY